MLSAHKSSSFSVQKNISSHRRKLWFCVVLTYSLALCMKLFNCRLCHETHTSFLLCQNEHAYRRTINVLQANIITFFLLHCNPSDSRTTGKIQLWLWHVNDNGFPPSRFTSRPHECQRFAHTTRRNKAFLFISIVADESCETNVIPKKCFCSMKCVVPFERNMLASFVLPAVTGNGAKTNVWLLLILLLLESTTFQMFSPSDTCESDVETFVRHYFEIAFEQVLWAFCCLRH